jgi:hypothetical protein
MRFNILTLKKCIVLFWALWWSIALLTDIFSGLKQLNLYSASWILNNNYPFLVQSLQQYSAPGWLPALLFMLIIIWCFISASAFWIAACTSKDNPQWTSRVNAAFVISLLLWLAFFIGDQIIRDYVVEQNHMVQGGFQLLTFIALYCLPNNKVID